MNFLLVNTYVSGNSVAYALRALGHKCYHIYSSLEEFEEFNRANNSSMYETNFIWTGSAATLAKLQALNFKAVIPGSDSALPLAEWLAEALQVPINNGTNPDRYDRSLVTKAIGEACNTEDFVGFLREHGKCVIKPKVSLGGGDRVRIVEVGDDAEQDPDMFATPYYEGVEHAVDIVSFNGEHRLCAVWVYTLGQEGWPWYFQHRVDLLKYEEHKDFCDRLHAYMSKALDSLGWKNGATHNELRVLPNGEPRLMEVNFRNNGHMDYVSTRKTFKHSQIDQTAMAWAGMQPPALENGLKYEARQHLIRVWFMNKRERRFEDIPWRSIETHRSVSFVFHHYRPHDVVPVSKPNMRWCAAHIIMCNPDWEQLMEDERSLRSLFI